MLIEACTEFGSGVKEISVVFDACHFEELAKEIAQIARQLESGPGG